jgi:hemerythrin-like metal-binding protein
MKKTSEIIWQDTQHQVLFELIDELKSKKSSLDIFTRLTNYAENHFALEEAYMLQLDYPKKDEHIQAHNKFRDELNVMMQSRLEFDLSVRESISIFLREWLTRHVLGIDKDFEAFVLSSDYK